MNRGVWRASLPGKTFLVGEYLALDGGPSILLCTSPRFELHASPGNSQSIFAPASPAGRFLAQHREEFAGWEFRFHDHHQGRGGLGASSAQFALLYAFRNQLAPVTSKLLREYRGCAWSGEGHPPSGADVVAQINGGCTWFDGRSLQVRELGWRFPQLSFTLVRTGHKLATHEHLKAVQAAPQERLRSLVESATNAVIKNDERALIAVVGETRAALADAGLTAAATTVLLEHLQKEPIVLAAKGCGAMGADVILILHERSQAERIRALTVELGLEICGSEMELAPGLQIHQQAEV